MYNSEHDGSFTSEDLLLFFYILREIIPNNNAYMLCEIFIFATECYLISLNFSEKDIFTTNNLFT